VFAESLQAKIFQFFFQRIFAVIHGVGGVCCCGFSPAGASWDESR
jgi:hypothetical protein